MNHTVIRLLAFVLSAAVLAGCGSSRHAARPSRHGSDKKETTVVKHIPIDRKKMPKATVTLLAEADSWLGVPYRYGGEDKKGVDCSALVLKVFESSLKIKVPRNSRKQYDFCSPVTADMLVPGDLVFFSTPKSSAIGHVGIYIGDDRMIHASSSKGVVVSSINDRYFVSHFKGAGRVDPYYALIEKRDAIPAEPSPEPVREIAAADLAAPRTTTPSVTLAELLENDRRKAVSASNEQADAEANVATAAMTTAETKPEPEPVAVMAAVHTSQPSATASTTSGASNPDEARRRVLSLYKEQPADSVMTSYFE